MRSDNSHNLKSLLSNRRQGKYKQNLIAYTVRTIEKKTGLTLHELKRKYTQKELYRIGLYYITTTNKVICEALKIPVEAGTRRKRDLEKEGRLWVSTRKRICPYTNHPARFLTTNADYFTNRNGKRLKTFK